MASLLKYPDASNSHASNHERGNEYWDRSHIDGIPFRGHHAPVLREAEYEALAERVYDAKVDTFDMSDPEQRERYQTILDRAANKWYRVLACDRQFVESKLSWLVYLEWVEPYMEIPASKLGQLPPR